tara:strand:- start:3717 stop:5309 length:1593 start_codon:yes stop_codon:yes gene_type:complete
MAEITSLPSIGKLTVGTNDYLLVANSSTKKARKLQAQSLFSTLTTVGTSSEQLYVSVTNRNQINFKGLKSGDTGLLTVATTDNNLVLTVLEAGIDLSLCNNATSGFLSSVPLGRATGKLAVNKGGTGLSSILKGSILYSNAADTITTTTLTTDGQLLIGNATLGYPTTGTIASSDGTINITNSAGGIDLSVVSSSKLVSTLDAHRYNINLNAAASTNFLSGDGTNEGITVDTSGRVFAGDTTPTVPTLAAGLTVGGSESVALELGNINHYGDRTIKFANSGSGVAGMEGKILGATPAGGNVAGGAVQVEGGAGAGTGTGGNLVLHGGNPDSGTGGAIQLKTYTAKNTSATAMTIAASGAIRNFGATTMGTSLAVTGTSTFTGAITTNGGIQPAAPVVQAEGSLTLTKASNAGRTTILPDISDNRTFTMPDPAAAGEYYHLVYFATGAGADGHNLIINGVNNDNTTGFYGAVVHHDTNETGQTSTIVYGSTTDDTITLASGKAFDLHFLATSTTQYYIWGWSAGDTAITIA